MFRKGEDHQTVHKRNQSTQNSVNALMAGMFRIAGSVAATTKESDIHVTELPLILLMIKTTFSKCNKNGKHIRKHKMIKSYEECHKTV